MKPASLLLIPLSFLQISCTGNKAPQKHPPVTITQPETSPPNIAAPKPGAWLYHLDSLDTKDTCILNVLRLVKYLDTETLSKTYTFERFTLKDSMKARPAPLNSYSLKTARAFRTNINRQLRKQGINFAGRFSLVGVGMTGSGENRWIIDRSSGRAYDFPYKAISLEFRKNSNLIIAHPKEMFLDELKSSTDPKQLCDFIFHQQLAPYGSMVELRPVYILWHYNQLIILGPKLAPLPRNDFLDCISSWK